MFKGGSDIITAADGGHEYSQGLRARQEPPLPNLLLWGCFWDVATMRPPAFSGAATIPIDKIEWYAKTQLRYDDEETDTFVWIIRRVDSFFVGKVAEKANAQSSGK